jgi:hypothetical protein
MRGSDDEFVADHHPQQPAQSAELYFLRYVYVGLCGWLLAIGYILAAGLIGITIVGLPAARVAFQLAGYVLWPFDKHIVHSGSPHQTDPTEILDEAEAESQPQNKDSRLRRRKTAATGQEAADDGPAATGQLKQELEETERAEWLSRGLFCVLCVPLLGMLHVSGVLLLLLPVVTAPMARMNMSLLAHVACGITRLRVEQHREGQEPPAGSYVLWYGRAGDLGEFSSSVLGQNICVFNLNYFTLVVLIYGFLLPHHTLLQNNIMIMIFALIAVIPISKYIGTCVERSCCGAVW